MISVTVFKNKTGIYQGFQTKGHAGFSRYGTDIVCAAASILVINTVNSMKELLHESFTCEACEEKGSVSLQFSEVPSSKAVLLLDSMILGLTEVEKQYGKKYISLKFKEV